MPSGDALARLITKEIDASHAPVIELGAGTGVFSRALIARGVDESDLTLIESGPNFLKMLRERFPRAHVVKADAARIAGLELYAPRSVGAVVSGLPLLSMSPRKIMGVLIRRLPLSARGRRLLSVHLRPALPRPEADPRAARPRSRSGSAGPCGICRRRRCTGSRGGWGAERPGIASEGTRMTDTILVIDAGTTSTRAMLFAAGRGVPRHRAGGADAALSAAGLGRA